LKHERLLASLKGATEAWETPKKLKSRQSLRKYSQASAKPEKLRGFSPKRFFSNLHIFPQLFSTKSLRTLENP
jgi:hypothetical protein